MTGFWRGAVEVESGVMIMNPHANSGANLDAKSRGAKRSAVQATTVEDLEDDEDEAGEPSHALYAGRRTAPALSFEDGPVDADDPNLSAWCAETGAEDRLDELGL